jgi:hypothetical protein
VRLVEVPVDERAAIIKCYLQQVPGARPHIPLDRHRPVADFAAIAAQIPVFRVVSRETDMAPATVAHRGEPTTTTDVRRLDGLDENLVTGWDPADPP